MSAVWLTVSRGSPVDARWSVRGMVWSQARHGGPFGFKPDELERAIERALA